MNSGLSFAVNVIRFPVAGLLLVLVSGIALAGQVPMTLPEVEVLPALTTSACGADLAVHGRMSDWMDVEHCRVSGSSGHGVAWFDHLFGDEEQKPATALVRLINELQFDQKNGNQWSPSLLVDASLPNASHRLHLIISDDRRELAELSHNVSPEQLRAQSSVTTAALRFLAFSKKPLRLDFDIGVRSLDVFVRERLRDAWSLTPSTALRLDMSARYAVRNEGLAIAELDLDRLLDLGDSVGLSNQLSWQQNEDHQVGMRWNQGVAFRHDEGGQQYWRVGLGTEGVTRPEVARNSYGVWLVRRHRLWRDWMFYEIEPHLTCYRKFDWKVDPSVMLRLELQFGHHF